MVRRGWGRWAATLAIGTVAIWLSYVFVMGVFLNSPLLRRLINPHPLVTQVEWRFAFSPWPRRLHVHGLEVRNRNPRRQWELRVDRAVADVAMLPLLRRTFRSWDVHADGVELRFRPTLPPKPEKIDVAELFPPIESYPDPPLRPEGPLVPPKPNAWTFEFHGARFEQVRQVWAGAYRFETSGVVTGDLTTRAGWWVRYTARAELRLLRGFVGEAAVARDGWVNVDASMALPDIPHTLNADRIRTLRARATGTMKLTSFDALVRPVGALPADDVRGEGALSFDAQLADGRLLPGSRLVAGGERMSGSLAHGWTVRAGRWKARASVDGATRDGQHAPGARFELTLEELGVRRAKDGLALETPRVKVHVRSDGTSIVEPLPQLSVSAYLAPTRPVPVASLLPEGTHLPFTLRGGQLSVRAGGEGDDAAEHLTGDVHAVVEGLDGELPDGARLTGTARLHVNLGDLRVRRQVAQLGGSSLRLEGVHVRTRRGEAKAWWMDVRVPRAWVALRQGGPAIRAELQAHARDTRPLVLLATRDRNLPRWAMPLLDAEGLSGQALLELGGHVLRLRDVNVAAQGLSVRGGLVRDPAGVRGALLARVRGFPVGIELGNGGADVDIVMPAGWLSERLRQQGVGGSGSAE